MEWLILLATSGLGAFGLYFHILKTKQKEEQWRRFLSENASIFQSGQGWSLILGYVRKTVGRHTKSEEYRTGCRITLQSIPYDSPLWLSAPEFLLTYHSQIQVNKEDGPLFIILLQELAYECFQRKIGGPELMSRIIELDSGVGRISSRKLKGHPGYAGYLRYALVTGKSRTHWPDKERPETDDMLLRLVQSGETKPEELAELLSQIRHKYRVRHSHLLHPDMGLIASLTCNLMADPEAEVSAIFGKKYPEILSRVPGIPSEGSIPKAACSVHHLRPLARHGCIACPVCFEPGNLVSGIRVISGTLGKVLASQTGELAVPLTLPVTMEQLQGLEEVRIGPMEGATSAALVDQVLAVADRLPRRIPVWFLSQEPLESSHRAMLEEWNRNVPRTLGDSV